MKQFYETYKDDEFVTPLVTQISWTNHLLIMSGSKTADERHFYMALCAKEHYSKRELERQIGTSYYERSMISAKKPMPESVSHDVRESIRSLMPGVILAVMIAVFFLCIELLSPPWGRGCRGLAPASASGV